MKQNNVHFTRPTLVRKAHIDETLCEQKQCQLEVLALLHSIPHDRLKPTENDSHDHTEHIYHDIRRIKNTDWDKYLTDDSNCPFI